jgi:hypothetical protein
MNILGYIHRLHVIDEYTETPPPLPCPGHMPIYSSVGSYIPRLTKEYINFLYITSVLVASPDEEPLKQGTYRQKNNNNLSSRYINHNDNHIVITTIHSCHFITQIHHIAQLDHSVVSLPVPPMFRTPSTKSHPIDEEECLKT